MKWIKAHIADLDDLRFSHCENDPEAEQVYSRMQKLAGKLDSDGLFIMNGRRLSIEEIAYFIRLPVQRVIKAMKRLERYKLLHVNGKGPQIADWTIQQVDLAKVREQTKERVTRYRALRKGETRDGALQGAVTTPDQDSDSDPDSDQDSDSDHPTTQPSSRKRKLAGGQAGSKSESGSDVKLNAKQRARHDKIYKVLASFGIRKPKINTLSIKLATRNFKSDEQMFAHLLAGIASSLADDGAKNKAAITAHRLENGGVDAQYEDPSEWDRIPEKVLTAAGISLASYKAAQLAKKYRINS